MGGLGWPSVSLARLIVRWRGLALLDQMREAHLRVEVRGLTQLAR